MPPVNLPEDGSLNRHSLRRLSALCFIESWASGAYITPRNARKTSWERERALSFKANRPLLHSSVGSLSGQTPFWCFRDLRKLQWKLLVDTERLVLNVSKHSPSILANLLSLPDGRSSPSWAYIAVSLIRNSLHIRCTSSYSRSSHEASHGHFFLPTISLEHLESCACRKRCCYTRNCPHHCTDWNSYSAWKSGFSPHTPPWITISSLCVSRGFIRVTDRCLEVAAADVIILRNGNDSTRETVSQTDQRKVSWD